MPEIQDLVGWVEERQERFIAISDDIWAHPQIALEETYACARQADDLAADGFTITRNVGGLPTAFMAEWGAGSPVIGFLGEYDALPGLSQESGATQHPLVPGGPGHGCGHNLLGTAALAAASALKAWLQQTGQPGTVRYYGCPAEEAGSGKLFMAADGAFDALDAAITWHPMEKNTVWDGSCLAVDNARFRFHGLTAHAAGSPELGRSALDAVELTNIGVNFLREHVIQEARIHYVITNGGGAPNVVPDDAEVWYFIRAPRRDQLEEITARVRAIARGAAIMTETKLEEYDLNGLHHYLPNEVLGEVAFAALTDLGPLDFTPEEHVFARTVAEGFPEHIRAGAIRPLGLNAEQSKQALLSDVFPPTDKGKTLPGSTDVAEVSWIAPTVQITTACFALGVPGHSWGITATGAMSIGHKGMLHAAKAMAMTAARLHADPTLVEKARTEFQQATGGRPYRAPLGDTFPTVTISLD
ncbi:MAG: amidohydrolase [Thermomicrobiales bacterium]